MKKIQANLKYNFLLPLGLAVVFLIITICLILSDVSDPFWIIGSIIFSLIIVFCILIFLLSYETAIFDERGIRIKSLLKTHANISWDSIESIKIEFLHTLASSTGHKTKYNWIRIYTNEIKRKKFLDFQSPYQIIYRKKNAEILKEYVEKYNPRINTETLDKEYSIKPKTKWGNW